MTSLFTAARSCLDAATPEEKLARTFVSAEAFARGELAIPADAPAPESIRMPGRPARPRLAHPRELPRRGFGTSEGLAAFIHAVAHIEFNAIDLAWDAAYRFRGMPDAFYADWVGVANDEARHFAMLRERLQKFGYDSQTGQVVVQYDAALSTAGGDRVEARRFTATAPADGTSTTVGPALNSAANQVASEVAKWIAG